MWLGQASWGPGLAGRIHLNNLIFLTRQSPMRCFLNPVESALYMSKADNDAKARAMAPPCCMHKAPAGLNGCRRARVGSLIGHHLLRPLHDSTSLPAISYKSGAVFNVIDN